MTFMTYRSDRRLAERGETSAEQWPDDIEVLTCSDLCDEKGRVRVDGALVYIKDGGYYDDLEIGTLYYFHERGRYVWYAKPAEGFEGNPKLPHASEAAAIYSLVTWWKRGPR